MFEGKILDKGSEHSGADDMGSVSTFTTAGIATWGVKSIGTDDATKGTTKGKRRRGRQPTDNPSRVGVFLVAFLIIFLGLCVAAILAFFGIRAEFNDRKEAFQRNSLLTVSQIVDSFDDYANVASMVHARMRHRPSFNATAFDEDPKSYKADYMAWSKELRQDFHELYQYVAESGLKVKAMQFDPNITEIERSIAEDEARSYYAENYPELRYSGFSGFNGDSTELASRWWNQSFYFPIHYIEPTQGNEAVIDMDYYSNEVTIHAVKALFETQKPSLTDRLSSMEGDSISLCLDEADDFLEDEAPSFGVILMHPGVRLSDDNDTNWPRDISSIILCIHDLLERSTTHQDRQTSLYIHDSTLQEKSEPVFMGGGRIMKNHILKEEEVEDFTLKLIDEIPFNELDCIAQSSCYQERLDIANRQWTVTIIDEHDVDKSRWGYITLISSVVFMTFVCLATRVVIQDKRNRMYSKLRAEAAAERNALVLENANKAAQTERELNDFLAHEVRNPLSAAMAATTFLKTELDRNSKCNRDFNSHFQDGNYDDFVDEGEKSGIPDDEADGTAPRLVQAREDIRVVDHALRFINELLRNMLDMHRASSGKMLVKFAPVDLLRDVLEPVAGMLHRGAEGRVGNGKGDEKVQVVVDCPEDIVVETDLLRLKQVVLNLGRNSVKFINEGFIRLRAEVVDADMNDDRTRFRDDFENDLDLEPGGSGPKTVRIYVEDSGSGIPEEKRESLFAKYQESLDLLSQGTGIGLHLCKNLVELMSGKISLDNEYDSGIPGNPGARFVVDLQSAPLDTSIIAMPMMGAIAEGTTHVNFSDDTNAVPKHSVHFNIDDDLPELPKVLNVLFVDDDRVLRKLFGRTIKMVAPDWIIREAANGETAILLAQEEEFDIIFCDMYMASVEKQLLGTETVAELRSNGCKSRICGLSANDKEMEFLEAGADSFLFKPIPCEARVLRKTL
eukprot:CAMPEP_0197198578 /NCGR_PEP_ID=MMETSP1423-20130617/33441_1 /TAXON_ID=476441 /ORGANISM="Pseudo-nitzschia heimii, Strain UNC1101" /LENGTH=958 /DNA_ID=CAMNT_0042652413 /DNA_START=41 /DNA_END=2913 /DNA_ORIENTATION=+